MRASYVWAGVMTLAIVGWMATGDVIRGGQTDTAAPSGTAPAVEPARLEQVRVETFLARERREKLLARGRTEVADRVHVVAETPGLVDRLLVDKGDAVSAGDVLCSVEPGARDAKLREARARLDQAQQDFEATEKLKERGFATDSQLRADRAALDAARSAFDQMRLDMARLDLTAPSGGIVESVPVEKGSMLAVGTTCATIVSMDPMRVIVQVSERDVGALATGMTGTVRLVTGTETAGPIVFIAPAADSTTRTFRVELEVPNPDRTIREGVTAEVAIELAATKAHLLPSSVLTLNDAGQIGVRTVDGDDRVGFVPVSILSDGKDGTWVAGLPDTVTVITVGQEYVVEGQTVDPVAARSGAA